MTVTVTVVLLLLVASCAAAADDDDGVDVDMNDVLAAVSPTCIGLASKQLYSPK